MSRRWEVVIDSAGDNCPEDQIWGDSETLRDAVEDAVFAELFDAIDRGDAEYGTFRAVAYRDAVWVEDDDEEGQQRIQSWAERVELEVLVTSDADWSFRCVPKGGEVSDA